jgi:hypothetical protein
MRARWRQLFTAPLLRESDLAMARSLIAASSFIRKTSRIFRIDSLSVGMVTPLLK